MTPHRIEEAMESPRKILVDDDAVRTILSIPAPDLNWLVDTEQLLPIQIRGRRLFELSQIEELVCLYKTVQARGTNNE